MSPNDVQAIINCLNNFNRSIDYKQWDRLPDLLATDLLVDFQKSSLDHSSKTAQSAFIQHLETQLKDIKSVHRDYNFFIETLNDDMVCYTDFKIETYTESGQMISSASGSHQYFMTQEGGQWKIIGIKRRISRLQHPASNNVTRKMAG